NPPSLQLTTPLTTVQTTVPSPTMSLTVLAQPENAPSASELLPTAIAADAELTNPVSASETNTVTKPSVIHLTSPLEGWIQPETAAMGTSDSQQGLEQRLELDQDRIDQSWEHETLLSDESGETGLEQNSLAESEEISPILYPSRVNRKRESLAAVELPSFPRQS
ncbi:MAG: hypothetical protein VKJ24_03565, partial [Synechococcales bacterium]|nr:hypothetical protein [Synechococcales bacterium]